MLVNSQGQNRVQKTLVQPTLDLILYSFLRLQNTFITPHNTSKQYPIPYQKLKSIPSFTLKHMYLYTLQAEAFYKPHK